MSQKVTSKIFDAKKKILEKGEKVKPEGMNTFQGFDYLLPAQVLALVNPVLTELKLLITFGITDIKMFETVTTTSKTTEKDGVKTTTNTKQEGTLVAVVSFSIFDIESDEKVEDGLHVPLEKVTYQGYGALLTYVERYFYSKLFGLALNEDDPDNGGAKAQKNAKQSVTI